MCFSVCAKVFLYRLCLCVCVRLMQFCDVAVASIGGRVVEYIVAIDVTRVRFPAYAGLANQSVTLFVCRSMRTAKTHCAAGVALAYPL